MRAHILAAAAVLALAACSTPVQPVSSLPAGAAKTGGTAAFATLAPVGTFEYVVAPLYTRNAQLRHNAAQALRAGAIDVATAQKLLAHTDLARGELDEAVAASKAGDVIGAQLRLDAARTLIDAGATTLQVAKEIAQ